ncbi:unnamed protein product [Cyprideis torosa]|uniref:Uncharacterized protein n=1 Tax=Cyprideis torosa TaxID=163714 RepID=A0A7R8WJU6_9CRUS|nr:unnamed protein product [Cyprideis torosa]CAG0902417.1 unnamed protein product [Cyprideis torosa]
MPVCQLVFVTSVYWAATLFAAATFVPFLIASSQFKTVIHRRDAYLYEDDDTCFLFSYAQRYQLEYPRLQSSNPANCKTLIVAAPLILGITSFVLAITYTVYSYQALAKLKPEVSYSLTLWPCAILDAVFAVVASCCAIATVFGVSSTCAQIGVAFLDRRAPWEEENIGCFDYLR